MSKTVSWTGEVKKIGGSRIIKDAKGNQMNRDLNGARRIFLRALVYGQKVMVYCENIKNKPGNFDFCC